MAERRISFAVVLCEDQEHEVLALRYLRDRFKLLSRQIRVIRAPPGGGSAEQFVRVNYRREVDAYRRRAASHSLCLLVLIDADVQAVSDRKAELEAQARRDAHERIALFIPKRNVETWARAFSDLETNEDDAYPPQTTAALRHAAERLVRGEDPGLPSVAAALLEAARLDDFT